MRGRIGSWQSHYSMYQESISRLLKPFGALSLSLS